MAGVQVCPRTAMTLKRRFGRTLKLRQELAAEVAKAKQGRRDGLPLGLGSLLDLSWLCRVLDCHLGCKVFHGLRAARIGASSFGFLASSAGPLPRRSSLPLRPCRGTRTNASSCIDPGC